MFKFNQLKTIHLEISNNCQASCPMCSRNINGGQENPLIKINDWTLAEFKNIMTPRVLHQIDTFYLCGTFGDPMMNNDLIEMCRYATAENPNLFVHVHTNGGARKEEWWQSLAQALPANHRVIFAIDGLEDTHSLYRIGTKYETVIRNAQAFISAGGIAEWAFIQFLHNEHQVDEARQRANNLGFKYFTTKNSSRFLLEPRSPAVDKHGVVTHYIEPASFTPMKFIDKKIIDNWRTILDNAVIECKVLKDKEIYIDAHKDFYACCWLANVPYSYITNDVAAEVREKMVEQHNKMNALLGQVNVLNRSIEDIINSDAYQSMWKDMWGKDKSIVCARTCGKHPEANISKCTDQFSEHTEFNE
jgi:MoaA/NifB/PqqE/SkfB family radical SAM enzyme